MSLTGDLESFRAELEAEVEAKEAVRAQVREMETQLRGLLSTLQGVHEAPNAAAVEAVLKEADEQMKPLQQGFAHLASLIAPLQFFKYHDIYRFLIQRCVFAVALRHFLRRQKLVGKAEAAAELGMAESAEGGFYLDLEDYLHGSLELARELARLSVNAVVMGDFGRPFQVRTFLGSLDAGFRSLNLKNDSLRRRFDALKYDLKKVEEVVYDLSIRNLKPTPDEAESAVPMQ